MKTRFKQYQDEIFLLAQSDPYVVGNASDIMQDMYDDLQKCVEVLKWIHDNPNVHPANVDAAVAKLLNEDLR